ncbi:hypothetical protein Y032_0442g1528 [Ancylostoma ceylanicum]|uniref:Uncharacterized protein n=1 Tax=Ancylostoma ceylanicum TaxID=53326 RepID=A0A016WZH7_9BILA|nr:hypothetical protein Y032_0442g1528 [Ancylostoma ceylanicum]
MKPTTQPDKGLARCFLGISYSSGSNKNRCHLIEELFTNRMDGLHSSFFVGRDISYSNDRNSAPPINSFFFRIRPCTQHHCLPMDNLVWSRITILLSSAKHKRFSLCAFVIRPSLIRY